MNEGIPGKYIHKKTRSNYIELKPDGTCVLYERGTGIAATYEVTGTDIAISGAGSTSQGKIQNGIIIDSEGEKWIRTDATDDPLTSITWVPPILKRSDFPWELIDIGVVVIIFVLVIFTRP
jgi:hypothetical protein